MLTLSRTRRIDWPRLVANLRKQGMLNQHIADAVGVTREGMLNWGSEDATGEPAFWTGAVLIELWCSRTGLHWTDLPVRVVTPSVSEVLRRSA